MFLEICMSIRCIHTLGGYLSALGLRSADLAKRGFAISTFNLAINFWEGFFRVGTLPSIYLGG